MAISDKLLQVNQVKQDIKVALENKGADLTGVEFDGYAEKIDEIETGEGDILYYGTGLDGTSSPYYEVKYNGAIVMFHLNNIIQDFPSIVEFRGLFIVNDGTNTTIGQSNCYNQPDGSSMGIISNIHMVIFSNGLMILKFDTNFADVVELTQAEYDALSVYDDNTYYLIVGE